MSWEDSLPSFLFSPVFSNFLVSVPLVQQRVQREIVTSDLFQFPA